MSPARFQPISTVDASHDALKKECELYIGTVPGVVVQGLGETLSEVKKCAATSSGNAWWAGSTRHGRDRDPCFLFLPLYLFPYLRLGAVGGVAVLPGSGGWRKLASPFHLCLKRPRGVCGRSEKDRSPNLIFNRTCPGVRIRWLVLGSPELRSLVGKMNRVPSNKAGTKPKRRDRSTLESYFLGPLVGRCIAGMGNGRPSFSARSGHARCLDTRESLAWLKTRSTLAEFSTAKLVDLSIRPIL